MFHKSTQVERKTDLFRTLKGLIGRWDTCVLLSTKRILLMKRERVVVDNNGVENRSSWDTWLNNTLRKHLRFLFLASFQLGLIFWAYAHKMLFQVI